MSCTKAIWDISKFRSIAQDHLSKLMNPFFPLIFRIILRINNDPIDLLALQRDILRLARLHIKGKFDPGADQVLTISEFTYMKQTKHPLVKPTDYPFPERAALSKAGGFDFEIYEFDRNDQTMQRVGRKTVAGHFLDTWGGGGLMLFRDGFRVMPYGTQGNDWLEIDKSFFTQRGGSRLRTHAMLGYIAITSENNPHLLDQTNREGLRENEAYTTFREVLKQLIKIVNVELQNLTVITKSPRPEQEVQRLTQAGQQLTGVVSKASSITTQLQGSVQENNEASDIVKELSQTFEEINEAAKVYESIGHRLQKYLSLESNRYQTLLELAGLGMTAEQVSHELNSLLDRSRGIIDQLSNAISTPKEKALLGQLIANIHSLREISSFLDPLTKYSRKRHTTINLVEELEIIGKHYPPINSGIVKLEITSTHPDKSVNIKANRGLILQIFDNILSNSLYWLDKNSIDNPKIIVRANPIDRVIVISDNGFGVDSDLAHLIFEPFVSMKPKGRGLGLFIVRELLELVGDQSRVDDNASFGYNRWKKGGRHAQEIPGHLDRRRTPAA